MNLSCQPNADPNLPWPKVAKKPNVCAAGAGFTLVELLVTITIMAIIASLVLLVSFQATQSARRSTTRSRIDAINALLMERWHSYANRRVPINKNLTGKDAAVARLNGIRMLMMLEMPERWNEIPDPTYVPDDYETALYRTYLRQKANIPWTPEYEGAECLYMIIMYGTGDGEARSLFRDSDIGDVDNDGAPEFLDAWGRPIGYLRWPAGFPSEIQPYAYYPSGSNTPALQPVDAMADDHDPFDVYHVDPVPLVAPALPYTGPPRAFRLLPLIYSAGPDGDSDLNVAQVASFSNLHTDRIDPYARDMDGRYSGQPFDSENDGDDGSIDNIHNHLKDVP